MTRSETNILKVLAMKPIEPSPIARPRPISTDAARSVRNAPPAPGSAAPPQAEPGVIARAPSAGSTVPVDSERVTEIRTALREGTYPLVPARVADAMIAANFILIEGEKD
jgi:negative regulator of flagellin synthesis FlgM